MNYPIKLINETLSGAARLNHSIIGVYSSTTIPEGAITVAASLRNSGKCLAKALYKMAARTSATLKEAPAIHVGGEALKECCWAAASWLGYQPMPPGVETFLSMGDTSGDGSDGKYLKDTPAICRESLADIGTISPAGPYLIAQSCSSIAEPAPDLLSVLCFGNSEQIRILCALIHFEATKIFTPITGAWGSGCATFVTYPAGLASNCPKDTAFLSPMAPEAHNWFPENLLALGIPITLAARMAEGYPRSFAVKCPEDTYPAGRES